MQQDWSSSYTCNVQNYNTSLPVIYKTHRLTSNHQQVLPSIQTMLTQPDLLSFRFSDNRNNSSSRPLSPPPIYTVNDAPPLYTAPVNNRQYQQNTSNSSSIQINSSITNTSNYQSAITKDDSLAECEDGPPDYTRSINCPTFIISTPAISKKTTRGRKHPTGYNLFYRHEFSRIHKDNPTLQASEVSKLVSSRWREMEKAEKIPYEKLSRDGAGNKKKRPLNGYHVFCKEIFHSIRQSEPSGDVSSWSKTAGAMWKKLSPDEQLQYRRKAMDS
jgi:hypothetical protein